MGHQNYLNRSGIKLDASEVEIGSVEIEPRRNLEGLGDIIIGLTQVEIVITGTPNYIRIQADNTNTGIVYIGKIGVLSDRSNDLVRLESGDETTLLYDDTTNALYAISDTTSQKINVGALL